MARIMPQVQGIKEAGRIVLFLDIPLVSDRRIMW